MPFPVSIKGVVIHANKVLLLKNPRGEWELPGGRLEIGETPEECVAREIAEETGWQVRVGPVLDTWLYHVESVNRHVFIATYGCHPTTTPELVLSNEHLAATLFSEQELPALNLPNGYRRSITTWLNHPSKRNNAPRTVP